MSSGLNPDLVDSTMEPTALADAMKRFPVVVFKSIPWVDMPPCEGCPVHDASDPLPTQAVITYRYPGPLGDLSLGRSHTYQLRVCGSCIEWELHLLTRKEARRVAEIVSVKVLMIAKER